MPQQTVKTEEFGVMGLNPSTTSYEAEVILAGTKAMRISIVAEGFETGVKRVGAFLAWLKVNHEAFKLPLEREIQNYDLVWDDVWDSILGEGWVDAEEGFLSEYIMYESVDFHGGEVHLWIDTSGLHTDHKVRVTMNDAMRIKRCEML